MPLRSIWIAVLVLGSLQPSVVHADELQALMMAPLGDADGDMTSSATSEVRNTLERQGVVFVVPPRGLSLDCETDSCRSAAASAAGADVTVTVLVWRPTSFREEGRVEVALTDVSGETVGAEVNFTADELLAAVQAARGAFERFGQRTRVALEITGIEGAAVLVDGRPVGAVPYRGTLAAGSHRIRVIVDGQVRMSRDVNVEHGAEPVVLRVEDRPVSAADPVEQRSSRSTGRMVAGAALVVAGAGAGAWVAVEAARGGCLDRNPRGLCTRERGMPPGPAIAVGVAGALMLTTGVVLIVRSRGSSEQAPAVSARLSPTSASLHVSF